MTKTGHKHKKGYTGSYKGRIFKCRFCDREYGSDVGLREHMTTKHPKETKAIRDAGEVLVPWPEKTTEKTKPKTQGLWVCPHCGKTFVSRFSYASHVKTHRMEPNTKHSTKQMPPIKEILMELLNEPEISAEIRLKYSLKFLALE